MNMNLEKLPPAEQITLAQARSRYDALAAIVAATLKPGDDYGILPGTSEPFLKKSGAEKLRARFGIVADPSLQDKFENWEKGIFFYRYRVTLRLNGEALAACEAGCTNQEDKFRFTWIETEPPDKATCAEMKRAKTGRWKKFDDLWVWQERREVSNPYDSLNSVIKRAIKRAAVGATLDLFAATAFFASKPGEDATTNHSNNNRRQQ